MHPSYAPAYRSHVQLSCTSLIPVTSSRSPSVCRAQGGLRDDGLIFVKENVCKEGFVLDKEDNGLTRSNAYLLELFARAGLKVCGTEVWTGGGITEHKAFFGQAVTLERVHPTPGYLHTPTHTWLNSYFLTAGPVF